MSIQYFFWYECVLLLMFVPSCSIQFSVKTWLRWKWTWPTNASGLGLLFGWVAWSFKSSGSSHLFSRIMKQLQLWFVDADALYKTCDVDSTGYGHTIIALKIETISQLMSWPSIIRWPPCTSGKSLCHKPASWPTKNWWDFNHKQLKVYGIGFNTRTIILES